MGEENVSPIDPGLPRSVGNHWWGQAPTAPNQWPTLERELKETTEGNPCPYTKVTIGTTLESFRKHHLQRLHNRLRDQRLRSTLQPIASAPVRSRSPSRTRSEPRRRAVEPSNEIERRTVSVQCNFEEVEDSSEQFDYVRDESLASNAPPRPSMIVTSFSSPDSVAGESGIQNVGHMERIQDTLPCWTNPTIGDSPQIQSSKNSAAAATTALMSALGVDLPASMGIRALPRAPDEKRCAALALRRAILTPN